jgi:hypothetical protein
MITITTITILITILTVALLGMIIITADTIAQHNTTGRMVEQVVGPAMIPRAVRTIEAGMPTDPTVVLLHAKPIIPTQTVMRGRLVLVLLTSLGGGLWLQMEMTGHGLVTVHKAAKPLPALKHRLEPKPWEVTTSGLTRGRLWARINMAMST